MGDRCSVRVKFGGKLTKEHAETLVGLLKAEDFLSNEDGKPPTVNNLMHDFYADEVNYGEISGITTFCDGIGLDYEKWNDAGGSYPEGLERSISGISANRNSGGGEPQFSIDEILRVEELATGLAGLLADAKWWAKPLPDLEIVT